MQPSRIKTINDLQEFLHVLYPNEHHDFPYIFAYVARHQGYLSKRLTKRQDVKTQFIKTISWLFALGSHLDIKIQDAIFERHPGVCPYCLADRCVCIITSKLPFDETPAHKIEERLKSKAVGILGTDAQSLGDHAKRINHIYPGNRHTYSVIGAWQLVAKFQEELAEVHEAASRYNNKRKPKSAVAEELADLLAWLLAAWDIIYPNQNIQDLIVQFYTRGCPECGNASSCKCDNYADVTSQLVEQSKLDEIDDLLVKLAKAVDAEADKRSTRVTDVRKSLASAINSQSEPIARTAASQAVELAQSFEDGLDKGAKNASNVMKIVSAIRAIVESLPFI